MCWDCSGLIVGRRIVVGVVVVASGMTLVGQEVGFVGIVTEIVGCFGRGTLGGATGRETCTGGFDLR
jgi:hypothetical protein